MIGRRDAFHLVFGTAAQTDGMFLGKRRVYQRSITCKDGSVRHVAWLSLSQELKPPDWSQCWVGLDMTALDPGNIAKTAARRIEPTTE
jgi:hypothetical protein